MTPPPVLAITAAALAQVYPAHYVGAPLEWIGRLAEQLASRGDSDGEWGTIYGAPIVAYWHGGRCGLWTFSHRADGPVVPLVHTGEVGVFVDVRGCDWLGVREPSHVA